MERQTNCQEIIEGNFDKAQKFTLAELKGLVYTLGQRGYLHEEEEILDLLDLIQCHQEKCASLNMEWQTNCQEIIEGNFDKAQKFTLAELKGLVYTLGQRGYLHKEEEILDLLDLIQCYQVKRTSLNAEIDRTLAESTAILERKPVSACGKSFLRAWRKGERMYLPLLEASASPYDGSQKRGVFRKPCISTVSANGTSASPNDC